MAASSLLLGTFTPRLDDKGRLTLPARLRPNFAGGVMVSRGQDDCLYLFTDDGFQRFAAAAIEADVTDANARAYQRMFLANTETTEPDGQGRITISPRMREYAGLTKEVVLTGIGHRMEIWDTERWATYELQMGGAYSQPVKGTLRPD